MVEVCASVVPGLSYHGRLMLGLFDHIGSAAFDPILKSLRIVLLHHAESPEFPLRMVIIAMVVGIGAGETGLPPFVGDRDFLDHMDGKW